jgi:2-haloacid dehalogenase
MASVLVFDVNETLLDLKALKQPFADAFGDPAPMSEWFVRLLHASLVATLTNTYEDFGSIGRRTLDVVAARGGHDLTPGDREAILGTMRRLPPHPDVPQALDRLKASGFSLFTLTNSSGEMVKAQLEHAGLLAMFDDSFSVESTGRYKPAPEPYLMTAERLGVSPAELRMVAAHDWDVWGATRAGCAAAFVDRAHAPFAVGEPPDIVGADLLAVADAVIGVDRPRT